MITVSPNAHKTTPLFFQLKIIRVPKSPAIALSQAEHKAIPTLKGAATAGNARQQLAKDIKDLRKYTNVPNESLKKAIDLNKKMYPGALKKN